MFSICESESTKSCCRFLDLEPLKDSSAERSMAKDTLALIQEIALEQSAVVVNTLIRHSPCGRES